MEEFSKKKFVEMVVIDGTERYKYLYSHEYISLSDILLLTSHICSTRKSPSQASERIMGLLKLNENVSDILYKMVAIYEQKYGKESAVSLKTLFKKYFKKLTLDETIFDFQESEIEKLENHILDLTEEKKQLILNLRVYEEKNTNKSILIGILVFILISIIIFVI